LTHETKLETTARQIMVVTNQSIGANIALTIIKLAIGTITGSMALIADGIHSVSDMLTDMIVIFGVHFGSKEPDSKHPYGHGRIETFAAVIIASVLIIVGAAMIRQASISIAGMSTMLTKKPPLSWSVGLVAVLSIIVKEVLYRLCRKVAIQTDSTMLYANAWHHRSDAFSSIAVLIGFVAVRVGYAYGDQIATIAVGLMIILVAVKIITKSMEEFTERAVDPKTINQIEQIINSQTSIRRWHKLRTRNIGREIFMDLHILVDPQLNVNQAHEITESLEAQMHTQITRPINITIHVEPDKTD